MVRRDLLVNLVEAGLSGDPRTPRNGTGRVAYNGELPSRRTLNSIDAEFALSAPVCRGTDRGGAIVILALVIATIVGFNLWLLRHLRCVYAPSLRGTGEASNCS